MSKTISLIIGIALAAFAVLVTKVYLDQQRQALKVQAEKELAQKQQNQIPVLVAKRNIPPGTAIDADTVEIMTAARESVPPQTATSLGQIDNMITLESIQMGEPIFLNKLMPARRQPTGVSSLAMATPVGKRAITIPVDNISSVGGMIKPGDNVDVLCTIPTPVKTPEGKTATQDVSIPFFQNVLVLAVGQQLQAEEAPAAERRKEQEAVSPIITLALSPQEANIIAFLQEQSKIRLVLRSPADSKIEPVQPISWDILFQYLMPQEYVNKQQEEKREEPKKEIEIYRGLEKGSIPLSK